MLESLEECVHLLIWLPVLLFLRQNTTQATMWCIFGLLIRGALNRFLSCYVSNELLYNDVAVCNVCPLGISRIQRYNDTRDCIQQKMLCVHTIIQFYNVNELILNSLLHFSIVYNKVDCIKKHFITLAGF